MDDSLREVPRLTGVPCPRLDRWTVEAFYAQFPWMRSAKEALGIELDWCHELTVNRVNWGHMDCSHSSKLAEGSSSTLRVVIFDAAGSLLGEAENGESLPELLRRTEAGNRVQYVLLIAEYWSSPKSMEKRMIQLAVVPEGYSLESWITKMKAIIDEERWELVAQLPAAPFCTRPEAIERVLHGKRWLTDGKFPIVTHRDKLTVARCVRYDHRLFTRSGSWGVADYSTDDGSTVFRDIRIFVLDPQGELLEEVPQTGWQYDGTSDTPSLLSVLSWMKDLSRAHYIVALTTLWKVKEATTVRSGWPEGVPPEEAEVVEQGVIVHRPADGFSPGEWWRRRYEAAQAKLTAGLATIQVNLEVTSSPALIAASC